MDDGSGELCAGLREGVHGKEGINRWCKEINGANEAKQLENKDTAAMLKETGWQVEKAVADADEWCSDEDA